MPLEHLLLALVHLEGGDNRVEVVLDHLDVHRLVRRFLVARVDLDVELLGQVVEDELPVFPREQTHQMFNDLEDVLTHHLGNSVAILSE